MFFGLITFMPDSPRHLIRKGNVEQARAEFKKIRRDLRADEFQQEFAAMVAQIHYEKEREISSYKDIFRLFRRRALV